MQKKYTIHYKTVLPSFCHLLDSLWTNVFYPKRYKLHHSIQPNLFQMLWLKQNVFKSYASKILYPPEWLHPLRALLDEPKYYKQDAPIIALKHLKVETNMRCVAQFGISHCLAFVWWFLRIRMHANVFFYLPVVSIRLYELSMAF